MIQILTLVDLKVNFLLVASPVAFKLLITGTKMPNNMAYYHIIYFERKITAV